MQQSSCQQFPVQTAYSQQPSQQPYSEHAYIQQAGQVYGQSGQQQYMQQGQQMPGQHSQYQQVQQPVQYSQQLPVQQVIGQQTSAQQTLGQQMTASVLGAEYCAQGEQVYFLTEKWNSLSGDDFAILDSRQQPVFKMDSSAFSIKQKRVLKNAKGQPVCSLKKKLLTSKQPTWFISTGSAASNKERVAVIKKDTYNGAHSASLFLSSNTTQFFAQPIPDYSARGDLTNRSFFVYKGAAPVAEIMRNVSTTERVTGKNQYALRVSHGIDCALMIAFCVVIDELFND